jgi:RNA polymerase sigma factor (sigma-70 family)
VTGTDADLVLRARAGDRGAFAFLLERHMPMAMHVCRRLIGTREGLEDIAQETAVQAMLGLAALRDPAHFGAWLTGIGLNVGRRGLRLDARKTWSLEVLSGGRLVSELTDAGPGPEALAEEAELSRSVRAAVADLPAGQRAAILLVYLGGLTYRETASALGIEVGTLKTRLHKGRQQLQRRLADLWMEEQMTSVVSTPLVEMHVVDVRRHPPKDPDGAARSLVVLADAGGTHRLPIWVGAWEGDSIAMLLEKLQVPRPLTHAFAASLLVAGGIQVSQVRINRLTNETFYAQVVLGTSAGERIVDSRPSDAIALALQMGNAIFVTPDILAEVEAAAAARPPSEDHSIGAAEIVARIVAEWPWEPKPSVPQTSAS